MNPKKTARFAGFLYLIIFVTGVIGQLFILDNLKVPGDAATTANNIMASESLFRLGIVIALIRQTVFILLYLVLYKLFKVVNKNVAVLMVVFALVSVPISMLSELNQIAALLILSGAEYLMAFTTDQLQALVPLVLDLREHGLLIAQLLSIWLLPLGYLVYKSGFLPRIFGVLLIIAGCGLLIDFVTFLVFPNFGVTLSLFTFWGEPLFALWLLIKGVNVEQWEKRALESA